VRHLFLALVVSLLGGCATAIHREPEPQISWHCQFHAEQSGGGPMSIVVGGRSFILLRQGSSGCRTLRRLEYRAHEVPEHAISAAAGWFAGGGEEFYAVLQRQTLVVYHRFVEETGFEHPRYSVIARIPLPATPNQAMQRTAGRSAF
jgi:hypothetical protein